MSDEVVPGSIKFDAFNLTNFDQSLTLNIYGSVIEMNIYESVNQPFVTADVFVDDSLSLPTQFPIVGQEILQITFKTPHPSFIKNVSMVFNVVGIKDMTRDKARNAKYVLKCVAPQEIKDWNTRVRKSYREQPIQEIVPQLAKDFLGIEEMKTVGETDGNRTIVIPNLHPSEAMKFLAREAKSATYKPSNFYFFQNCDGFHFQTLDSMIQRKGPAMTDVRRSGSSVDKYFGSEFNFKHGSPAESTSVGGGRGQSSTKPYDWLRLQNIDFLNIGDYEVAVKSGALENKVRVIDPVMSLYEETGWSYFKNYSEFTKTTQSSANPILTESNPYISGGDTNIQYFQTNKGQTNDYSPEQKHEMLGGKIATSALLNNILVNISIPGDSEKRVGQVIDLQIPEYGATDDIETQINKHFSGEYLILSLRHIWNHGGYSTVMLCGKNAYEKAITSPASNAVLRNMSRTERTGVRNE